MRSIQDLCIFAKMEILEKKIETEVDKPVLQVLTDKWVALKLRLLVKHKVDRRKLLTISGLEDHKFSQRGKGEGRNTD